jgi:hypothetical protein
MDAEIITRVHARARIKNDRFAKATRQAGFDPSLEFVIKPPADEVIDALNAKASARRKAQDAHALEKIAVLAALQRYMGGQTPEAANDRARERDREIVAIVDWH